MFKNAITIIVGCMTLAMASAIAQPGHAELRKRAKITKNEAEHIALSQAPRGKVRSAALEITEGKLIWTFAIAKPGEAAPTKIQVDAMTGKIVSVPVETSNASTQKAGSEKSK